MVIQSWLKVVAFIFCHSIAITRRQTAKCLSLPKFMLNEFATHRLIISSPDTDVAVLCCYHYYHSLQGCLELFFKTGTRDKLRYIPVHVIGDQLGASVCNLLPIFHCITVCDSTSSFLWNWKIRLP